MNRATVDDLIAVAHWFLTDVDDEHFGRFFTVSYIKVCGAHDQEKRSSNLDLDVLRSMTIGRLINHMTERFAVDYGET
jgi:hypothetical protein